jgi:hypothetical protein
MLNCSNALLNHLVADIVDHIIYFIGDDNVDDNVDESVITNMLNGPI